MNHLALFASHGSPLSAYGEAAERLGVHLSVAVDASGGRPRFGDIAGVIALDREAALWAAGEAEAAGVLWHSVGAVSAATHVVTARGRWLAAGLPCPWFVTVGEGQTVVSLADRVRLPCVVRTAAGEFSTLVETFDACERAVAEARRESRVAATGSDAEGDVLLEAFVPGDDYVIDAIMDRGTLHVLAIFEAGAVAVAAPGSTRTFLTPPALTLDQQRLLAGVFAHAALALGLQHGPIQGTCRANEAGLFVLDVAPYPVSFPFSTALRFVDRDDRRCSFEELVVRHARGDALDAYAREGLAVGAAVMRPPGGGDRLHVRGVPDARQVRFIDGIHTTEGAPGRQAQREGPCVIVARAVDTSDAVQALDEAQRRLSWTGEPAS